MSQFISRKPYDDLPDTAPIWRTEAFAGAFGDPYVRDSGLEGGQTCNSMDMVADLILKITEKNRATLSFFDDAELRKLDAIRTDLKAGAALDRAQLQTSMRVQSTTSRSKTVSQDVEKAQLFLADFLQKLENLRPGGRLVVPGGWSSPTGGHAVIYIVFCDAAQLTNEPVTKDAPDEQWVYSFATCNTGDGVNYHPQIDCEYYPKSKHQCAIIFEDIPRHRLIEESFWYMLFKMKVISDSSHGPEMLYEVLLPHLCGNLVYTAVSKKLERNGHWETIQRSGTCFMRSILTSLRFMMKRDGFSRLQQKQLFVALRLAYVDIVSENLEQKELGPQSSHLINESDIQLIEIACDQATRSVSKLLAYEDRLRGAMQQGPAGGSGPSEDDLAAAAAAAAEDESIPGRVWVEREDRDSIETLRRVGSATLGLGPDELSALEHKIAKILSNARATLGKHQFKITDTAALDLSESAQLSIFPGFDLILDAANATPDPGPASDARPDPFSDTKSIPTPTSAKSFSTALKQCVRQCQDLRTKSSSAGTLAILHQIIHSIQHLILRIPFPRSVFSSSSRTSAADADKAAGNKATPAILAAKRAAERMETIKAESSPDDAAAAALWQDIDNMATVRYQRNCLQALHQVTVQYLSACHSVSGDRSDDAKRQMTTACILCLADRIARINVLDGLSLDDCVRIVRAFGCAYLPLTLALNGVPFRAEDSIDTTQDDDEVLRDKCKRLLTLLRSSDSKPYRLMTKTLGEEEFEVLASSMVVTNPQFAELLGNVLRYFHQLKDFDEVFSMKNFCPFMLYDKSPTKKFLDLLMHHCDVVSSPPGSKQTDKLKQVAASSPASPSKSPGAPGSVIVSSTRALHLREVANRFSHMKPVEKCATWMAADWGGVSPDFDVYRDLHFLFRLALEPAVTFRGCNPSLPKLWYTTHVKPTFFVAHTNPEGDFTIMQLCYASHAFGSNPFIPLPPGCKKPLIAGARVQSSLGNPARYLRNVDNETTALAAGARVETDEDRILMAPKLETFDDCLSEEDAELLFSILSTPYLSIPLLLHYFSENRVSQMAHSGVQNLVESVLFEPKSYSPRSPTITEIDTVPVATDDRDRVLSTPNGALLFECVHAPDSVFLPLTKIIDNALALCVGGDKSFFAPLLLFLIRTSCRALCYFQHAEAHSSDGLDQSKTSKFACELQTQLQTQCLQRLGEWQTAAHERRDIKTSVKLQTHMLLILDRSDAWKFVVDIHGQGLDHASDGYQALGDANLRALFSLVQNFLCAAAFVVHWHVHDDPSDESKSRRRRRNLRGPLGTAAAAAQRMHEQASEDQQRMDDIMSSPSAQATSDTPMGSCFAAMEVHREQLLHFMQHGCGSRAIDHIVTNMVNVALRNQPVPQDFSGSHPVLPVTASETYSRSWAPLTTKPLSCIEVIESQHPYIAGTDRYWTLSFPDSPHISISFDNRTSMEADRDYIEFFKDGSFVERWGSSRYTGGSQSEWPGANGRAPLLIPADSVIIHFHSDDSIQDWGFRITASAPVNQGAVSILSKEVAAFTNKTRMCEHALAQCRNSLPQARNLVQSSAWRQQFELSQQRVDEKGAVRGLYKNVSSSYFVNVQSAEVFFENRLLMPTPVEIASHSDFRQVFSSHRGGLAASGKKGRSEMPYCTLISKTKYTQHIKIIEEDEEFDVVAWSPLASHRVDTSNSNDSMTLSLNFPVTGSNGGVVFCDKNFERVDLDQVVTARLKSNDVSSHKPSIASKAAGDGLFEDLLVEQILSNGLDELPEVYECKRDGGDAKLRWLLMFVQPDVTNEELKNHPGTWYEIKVHCPFQDGAAGHGAGQASTVDEVEYMLSVYELNDFAHVCYRTLVYTSDHRFSLADLPVSSAPRDEPAAPAQQFAAGKFFGSLFAYPGQYRQRPGVGKLRNLSVSSITIRRKRAHSTPQQKFGGGEREWGYEELVPTRLLTGLIPDCLLGQFQMWRTGPRTLRGYKFSTRASNCLTEQSLHVELVEDLTSAGRVSAVVRLLQPFETGSAPGHLTESDGTLTLFNLARCCDKSTGHIARLMSQVDSLSHVVAWSRSKVETLATECLISMVQLVRLGSTFHVTADHEGTVRLSSAEYAGLFIRDQHPILSLRSSDRMWARPSANVSGDGEIEQTTLNLVSSIPKFLELRDSLGQSFVFLPNYGQRRLEVKACPFNTDIHFDKSTSTWASHVDTRFYVYPVHISGAFFLFPSIASSLYMTLQHMMHRDYVRAARVISSTNADRILSSEGEWVMGQFQAIGKDSHPHAHACRLKLAIMCNECGIERLPWQSDMTLIKDYEQYLLKFAHIAPECSLTLLEEAFLISKINKDAAAEREREKAKRRRANRSRPGVAPPQDGTEDDDDNVPTFVTLRANYLHARGARTLLNRNPDPAIRSKPVHMDGAYIPTVKNMGGLTLLQYEYRMSSVAVANEDCTETVSAMQRLGNFGAGSDASGTAREILRYERPHDKNARLTGAEAFNLLVQLDSDRRPVGMSRLTGSSQSDAGFCFLYELLTGQTVVELGVRGSKRPRQGVTKANAVKNDSTSAAPLAADSATAWDNEQEAEEPNAIPPVEMEEKYQDVADMGFGVEDGWAKSGVLKLIQHFKGDIDAVADLMGDEPEKARAIMKDASTSVKKKKKSTRIKLSVHSVSGVTHVLAPIVEPFEALQRHLISVLGYDPDDIKETFLYRSQQIGESTTADGSLDDGLDAEGRWTYSASSVSNCPPLRPQSCAKEEGLKDGDHLFFRVVADSSKHILKIARGAGYNVQKFHCDILLDMLDNEVSAAETLLQRDTEKTLNAVQKYQIFNDAFPKPTSDADERPNRDGDVPAPSWILAKLLIASYLCKTTDNFKQFSQVQSADNQLYGVLLAFARAREEQFEVILQQRDGLGLVPQSATKPGPLAKSRMAEEFPMFPYSENAEYLNRGGVRGFMERRSLHTFWKCALRSAVRYTRKNLRESADVDLFSAQLHELGDSASGVVESEKLGKYLKVSRWVLKAIFFHIPDHFRKKVLATRATARAISGDFRATTAQNARIAMFPREIHGRYTLVAPTSAAKSSRMQIGIRSHGTPDLGQSQRWVRSVSHASIQDLVRFAKMKDSQEVAAAGLSTSAQELRALCSVPLSSEFQIDDVVAVTRQQQLHQDAESKTVSETLPSGNAIASWRKLPFDLSGLKSGAALNILNRMNDDLSVSASSPATIVAEDEAELQCLPVAVLEALIDSSLSQAEANSSSSSMSLELADVLQNSLSKLGTLHDTLRRAQERDYAEIQAGILALERLIRQVGVEDVPDSDSPTDAARKVLWRLRSLVHPPSGTFGVLAASIASTNGIAMLQRLNGEFLSESQGRLLQDATTTVLLKTIRRAQTLRVVASVVKLQGMIQQYIVTSLQSDFATVSNGTPELSQVPVSLDMIQHALKSASYHAPAAAKIIESLRRDILLLKQESVSEAPPGLSLPVVYALFHVSNFSVDFYRKTNFVQNEDPEAFCKRIEQLIDAKCCLKGRPLVHMESPPTKDARSTVADRLKGSFNIIKRTSQKLAREVLSRRAYTTKLFWERNAAAPMDGGSEKYQLCIEPRFLLFEFVTGFLLRRRQCELVSDFVHNYRAGRSCVFQMIMGAGKTAVIGPLLALLLADGRSLVTQVCPAALLDMTMSVMRNRFSSIVVKHVLSFKFDRSSDESNSLEAVEISKTRLKRAVKERSVVCATPASIKSLLLKYIDLLFQSAETPRMVQLADSVLNPTLVNELTPMRQSCVKVESMADHLAYILGLWRNGVALLDEVDLLLHPLKSELNFPIGKKVSLDLEPHRWTLPFFLLDGLFEGTKQMSNAQRATTEPGTPALEEGVLQESTKSVSNQHNDAMGDALFFEQLAKVLRDGVEDLSVTMSPHLVLLDARFYHANIKPLMAKWAAKWLLRQSCIAARIPGAVSSASHNTDSADATSLLIAYLTAAQPGDGSSAKFLSALSKATPAEAGQPLSSSTSVTGASDSESHPHPVALVNLACEWIQVYLPHILSKINRVSYGLLSTEPSEQEETEDNESEGTQEQGLAKYQLSNRLSLSVPFVGKDVPSTAAEFACAEVLIGLTVLSYRYEGMRVRDAKILVRWLKDDLMNESGPFAERPTRIKFEDWKQQAQARRLNDALASSNTKDVLATDGVRSTGDKDSEDEHSADQIDIPPLELLHYHNDELMKLVKAEIGLQVDVIRHYLCVQVFPRLMKQKLTKFSASGVDLGGEAIFGTRLGFSGTPSDLLPLDLRPCIYEKGSEAKVIRTLSDPSIADVEVLERGWTVDNLLKTIASCGKYQALIDTGALITGLSNVEVARLLLEYGLTDMDGCVYLDDDDKKMVLMRSSEGTGETKVESDPVPLETSGVAVEKRFTFYDQVHTTGMDIPQVIDAQAVITIGKDMTLRDFSQGCWRMRDLGQGQCVHVVVPCEVEKLMEEVASTGAVAVDSPAIRNSDRSNLVLLAWLTRNAIRSEEQQAVQLRAQNVKDVTRRMSLGILLRFSKPPSAEKQLELKLEAEASSMMSHPDALEVQVVRDTRTRHCGFGLVAGTLVTVRVKKTSVAYRHGLRNDQRIVAVDGNPVYSRKEYRRRTQHRQNFRVTCVEEQEEDRFLRSTLAACPKYGRFQPPLYSAADVRAVIDGLPASLQASVDRSFSKDADHVRRFILKMKDILPEDAAKNIPWGDLFSAFASSPDMTYPGFRAYMHKLLCQQGFLAASVDHVIETARKAEQSVSEDGPIAENKLEKILKLADKCPDDVNTETAVDLLQACLDTFKEELSSKISSTIRGMHQDDDSSATLESEKTKLESLEKKLFAAKNTPEVLSLGKPEEWPLQALHRDLQNALMDTVGSMSDTDGSGHDNHDREIVQEQEKEKQQLQQSVVSADVQAVAPAKPQPWSLDQFLADESGARKLIGESFYPLSFFKMSEESTPLEYPNTTLISEHHSSFVPPIATASALKDAEKAAGGSPLESSAAAEVDDSSTKEAENESADAEVAKGKRDDKDKNTEGSDHPPPRLLKNAFVLWEWHVGASDVSTLASLEEKEEVDEQDTATVVAWRCVQTGELFATAAAMQKYAKKTGRIDFEETEVSQSHLRTRLEQQKSKVEKPTAKGKPGTSKADAPSKKKKPSEHNERNVLLLQKVLGDTYTAHQYNMILYATGNDVRQAVLFIQRAPRRSIYQAIAQVEAALKLYNSGGGTLGGNEGSTQVQSKRSAAHLARVRREKQIAGKAMREVTDSHSQFLILLSLEEAETLRRALIAKQTSDSSKSVGSTGRLLTLEGTVLFDFSGQENNHFLSRQPSLQQPGLARSHTVSLMDGVDKTDVLVEARQCFRFFNCNLWYEEKDIITLLRALKHTECAARQRHFEELSVGRARRSRQDWTNASVAAVFSDQDERKRVRMLKTTIQLQREMLRSYGTIAEAFVALSTDGGTVKVSALSAAFVSTSAVTNPSQMPIEEASFNEVSRRPT